MVVQPGGEKVKSEDIPNVMVSFKRHYFLMKELAKVTLWILTG